MSDWISVKERLPEPDTGVLVTDGTYRWSARCFYDRGRRDGPYWCCYGYAGYDMDPDFGYPTHWMPMPEPPKKRIEPSPEDIRRREQEG